MIRVVFSHNRADAKAQQRMIRGTVTVEFAMLLPLLLVLLFGIIEFSLIFKDVMTLNHAARESARKATMGASTTEITDLIEAMCSNLDASQVNIGLEYRTYSGGWGGWQQLADVTTGEGLENNAPVGAQIRVTLTYPHRLIFVGWFPGLADDPDSHTLTVAGRGLMRRE